MEKFKFDFCKAHFRDWASATDAYEVAALVNNFRPVQIWTPDFPLKVGSDGRVYGAAHIERERKASVFEH